MSKRSLNLRSVARLMTGAVSMAALATVLMAALMATLAATPVHAQVPVVPQAFYGTIEIDGQPAPAGAAVEARGTNVKTEIVGNPITTTEAGKYGGPLLSNVKLIVQGNVSDGSAIEFYINGVKAECALPGGSWQSSHAFLSGDVTALNLRVGQAATSTPTPTSTPSRTPTAMRVSPTPRATSTATPRPARTPAPGSSATPESVAATATEATGTTAATATPEAAQQVLPSSTPNAAGDEETAQANPTPIASAAALGTPEPPTPAATAAALVNAAQAAGTRPPATLVAKAPAAPRSTSAPILGSDAAPAAAPVTAASSATSSILPWAGAVLVLLAAGLGFLGFRLRKSGRAVRDREEPEK